MATLHKATLPRWVILFRWWHWQHARNNYTIWQFCLIPSSYIYNFLWQQYARPTCYIHDFQKMVCQYYQHRPFFFFFSSYSLSCRHGLGKNGWMREFNIIFVQEYEIFVLILHFHKIWWMTFSKWLSHWSIHLHPILNFCDDLWRFSSEIFK